MRPKKPKRSGWRQHYPPDLLHDVVILMEGRGMLYQEALEWACWRHGVEYRH